MDVWPGRFRASKQPSGRQLTRLARQTSRPELARNCRSGAQLTDGRPGSRTRRTGFIIIPLADWPARFRGRGELPAAGRSVGTNEGANWAAWPSFGLAISRRLANGRLVLPVLLADSFAASGGLGQTRACQMGRLALRAPRAGAYKSR